MPDPANINQSSNVTPTTVSPVNNSSDVELEMRRLTRRSLLTGGVAAGLGFGAYGWLKWLAFDDRVDTKLPWPLRRMLDFNASVSQRVFGTQHLAPEFPRQQAREPRANGYVGLSNRSPGDDWRLQVTTESQTTREFSLQQIRELPKVEMVTELKCVEGWSQVVHWGGARLIDFLRTYQLGTRDGGPWTPDTAPLTLWPYVQLATPDDEYFVGLDMPSAIHPQTLLCYEMNGQPLTAEHGAPLRLVITVKYGIKNIKRIGQLRFLKSQPRDYWAERGYDWYAGL